MKVSIGAALAVVLLAAGAARADALQERLLAGARAATEAAFTRSSRMEQKSVGSPEVNTRVERYDPARPEGQRWTLVSVDGKPPSAKDLAQYGTFIAKAPVPGYWRLARWIGGRAACDGRACRYPQIPKGTLIINGHDLSADTTGELIVAPNGGAPFVERTHFVSTKGFRMMFVAKVERVEATQTYRLEGGRPMLVESVTELTGSMLGKAGSMRTVASFSYAPPK